MPSGTFRGFLCSLFAALLVACAGPDARVEGLNSRAARLSTSGSELLIPRQSHTSTLLLDGRVLLAGGDVSGQCELIDPMRGRSQQGASLQAPRRGHHAFLQPSGKVLLLGGTDNLGLPVTAVEEYNPQSDITTLVGSLQVGRDSGAAVMLADGQVLLVGGAPPGEPEIERFDPASGSSKVSSVALGGLKQVQAALRWDGMVWIYGNTDVTRVFRHDPDTGFLDEPPLTIFPPIFYGQRASGLLRHNGDWALTGGYLDFAYPTVTAPMVTVFPETGPDYQAFLTDGGRLDHTATETPSGNLVLAGGYRLAKSNGVFAGLLASVSVFDLGKERSAPVGVMKMASEGHAASALPWGDTLLTGGQDDSEVLLSGMTAVRESEHLTTSELPFPPVKVMQLTDGRVVFTGNGASSVLDPNTLEFSSVRGLQNLVGYALAPLTGGSLLVTGGHEDNGFIDPVVTMQLLAPVTPEFTPAGAMFAHRTGHGALWMPADNLFPSEQVLLVGGTLKESYPNDPLAETCLDFSCTVVPSLTDSMTTPEMVWLGETRSALISGCPTSKTTPPLPLWTFYRFGDQMAPLEQTEAPCRPAMAALPGGYALLHGGQLPSPQGKLSSQILRFDSSNAQVTAVGSTTKARWQHAAITLPSGDVLLLGGRDEQGALADVERVDGKTFQVTSMPPLQEARQNARAWPLPSGKILVTGDPDVSYVQPEIYDPATGASEMLTSSFVEAAGASVNASRPAAPTAPSEGLWVLGGERNKTATAQAHLLGARGTVLATGTLHEARAWHTTTQVMDGLLLVGGKDASGKALASIERFDPVQKTSTPVGTLQRARYGHSITRLSSGDLLVIGGESEGGLVQEIELLSAQGGAATTVGKLSTPRSRHAAIYLENGEVWVAGGLNEQALVTQSERVRLQGDTIVSVADAALTLGAARGATLPDGDALVMGDNVSFLRRSSGEVIAIGGMPELPTGSAILPSGRVAVCGIVECAMFEPRSRSFESLGTHSGGWLQGCGALSDSVLCVGLPDGSGPARYAQISPPVEMAFRPVITEVPSEPLGPGVEVTIQGSGFTGQAPASQSSLYPPRVLLQPDDGPPRIARVTAWTPTSATFLLAPSAYHGDARLFVSQAGVLSLAARVRVAPSLQATACSVDRECSSGFCTDGVCCEQRCQGACEACSAALQGEGGVDGSCLPIAAGLDPKDNCSEDSPLSCQRTGVCDGNRQCQLFPDGTPCQDQGTCSQGSCLQPQPPTCDAAGERLVSPGGQPIECTPFRCRDDLCLSKCVSDEDCIQGFQCTPTGLCRACSDDRLSELIDGAPRSCERYVCQHGACLTACDQDQDCSPGHRCSDHQCSAFCDDAANAVIDGNTTTPCTPFRCRAGACASVCYSNVECADGQVCGLDGRCGPVPSAPPIGLSCSTSPSPGRGSLAGVLLLASAGLLASRRRRRLASGVALLTLSSTSLAADPPAAPAASASTMRPPSSPPEAPSSEALTRAKEDFRKGVALFEAGDLERALAFFRRSMESYPSKQNTINAALALDRLGRHDEALELYEEVIGKFSSDLGEEERASVPRILAGLRAKVGELWISSSTDGNIFVDGRPRGHVRAEAPLLVTAGQHRVRVSKDGYDPYETTVNVQIGARVAIEARLSLMRSVGRLRIEAPDKIGVVLDGLAVGATPWEGSLAPGVHTVVMRGEGTGSVPIRTVIVEGQITLLRPKLGALGPPVKLSVSPATAELTLDGVPLGRGRWEGGLPVGEYTLSAAEDGYFPATQAFSIGSTEATPVSLALRVDERHPRWPRRRGGKPWAQAMVGYAVGTSLHSGAEDACPERCLDRGLVQGFTAGARGGYELKWGFSLEITVGYLALSQPLVRTAASAFPRDTPTSLAAYRFEEERALRGPWFSGGASARVPLGGSWTLRGRLAVGVALLSARSRLRGTATADGTEAALVIPNAEDTQQSSPLLLLPEVGVESRLGAWRFGASLGGFFLLQSGPSYDRDQVFVSPGCTPAAPGAIGCAPVVRLLADERSHGPSAFLIPQLSLLREFSEL